MATVIEEDEIERLRIEIDLLRKELSDKEAVLRYLELRNGKKAVINHEAIQNIKSDSENLHFDVDELIMPSKGPRTLVDDVKDAIARFGNKEFTVAHVEAALIRLGAIKDGADKVVRPRISSILAKLYDAKELDRTFTGKGNVPHKYKNINTGSVLTNLLDNSN